MKEKFKPKLVKNDELGLSFQYWTSSLNKNERVFLSKQVMEKLGYTGGNNTLTHHGLEEGIDKVTLHKKDDRNKTFFKLLEDIDLIGSRSKSIIMLYDTGIWKLIMGSKKKIGIKTRNWLAREVIPSIVEKGYYSVSDNINNPMSMLNDHTEITHQIKNSKLTASYIKENAISYSEGFNQIHQLVCKMDAKDIKEKYGVNTSKSARETLRIYAPELACTESVIDELLQMKKTIDEIRASKAHETLPPAFESLYKLGIKFKF